MIMQPIDKMILLLQFCFAVECLQLLLMIIIWRSEQ